MSPESPRKDSMINVCVSVCVIIVLFHFNQFILQPPPTPPFIYYALFALSKQFATNPFV